MLLGSVCCWGAVPVLLRQLTSSVDSWTANGFRYPFSALFYWPILWQAWQQGKLTRRLMWVCLMPALLTLGGQVMWALAPYYLSASAVGFLVRFAMLWAISLAMLLFVDERRLLRHPMFYTGLFLSLGGFVAFMFPPDGTTLELTPQGILIMFFCSLFFGLYTVSIRHYLQSVPPVLAFGLVSQFVSLGLLAAMMWWGSPSVLAQLQPQAWLMLMASSVLGIALGHVFLYSAIQHLGAAITTGAQSATPFVTAALAFTFIGERLSAWQWAAGLTIVVGALVLISSQSAIQSDADRSRQRRPHSDKSPMGHDGSVSGG